MTSKDYPLTGILKYFTYKEETYLAKIIIRDFLNIADFGYRFSFGFCMGYCIMISCFVMRFGIQKNDLSYHYQWLIRLSRGEKYLKIYPNVVLEFDVKLRVAFLFVLSIVVVESWFSMSSEYALSGAMSPALSMTNTNVYWYKMPVHTNDTTIFDNHG